MTDALTPAQRLMQEHASKAPQGPTIEDVIDEEDVAHPPPSKQVQQAASADAPNGTVASSAAQNKVTPGQNKPAQGLDTQSEELFPALGGPKSRAPAAVPTAWGKRPASLVTADANGTANGFVASSNASSGASTPVSGVFTPPSTSLPVGRRANGPGGHTLSLPGRAVEQIEFAPSQLMPRSQLKKPISEILREINRTSKAKVSVREGAGGKIIFSGEGNTDAVRMALKNVASQVGARQFVKIDVPSSVRPHIIGRQGETIKAISKRTQAKINIPKQEDSNGFTEDDDTTVCVEIEGDPVSAELARREIEAILSERTANVNIRLQDIPAELFPFIAGPHNTRINALQQERNLNISIPHYYTWEGQAPPQPDVENGPVAFVSRPGHSIRISGERLAAQQARAEIENLANQLKRQLTLEAIQIERSRHQFIAGDRGEFIHDILEETGCTVVLPPGSHDGEEVFILGPAAQITGGSNKVMDLASSMAMTHVDVSRLHPNAPGGGHAHAIKLARYLHERKFLKELEKTHSANIVLPTAVDAPSAWQIFSRDGKNGMRARTEVSNLVAGHPPSRLRDVEVNPFFHKHLQEQLSSSVRERTGVLLMFPNESEDSSQLLLVFETPGSINDHQVPRRAPSAKDVEAFGQALALAEEEILNAIEPHGSIKTEHLDASARFHDRVCKHIERDQNAATAAHIPMQTIPSASARGRALKLSRDSIAIRGPADSIEEVRAKVRDFLAQEIEDEKLRSHVTTFDYPQKFANFLIGKKGENIRKLRDEFDVEIQVGDGQVQLTGPPNKAKLAKTHILALAKRLEDEVTHIIKIKPQYHRDLIGRSGTQVNRLQTRYNVKINFPRTATHEDASDAGGEGAPSRQRNQAPDEVVIKGPKRGADEAREELMNLLQYTTDNSHTATVSVAQSQVPSLIGSGGREMENLRLATGAQIDVPGARDGPDASGRVEIKVKGSKAQVDAAKKQLQERAKTFDDTVVRTIDVDRQHHSALIGSQGANIRELVLAAGGSDDRRDLARTVRFPRQEAEGNTIRIEGKKSVVDKIIESISKTVADRESQTVKLLEIAPEKHRLLIGRGGDTRRALEAKFHITLDVPKQSVTGAARSQVKVSGQPEDVEKAASHIVSLVKDLDGDTVNVPRACHHVVAGENGAFFRRLRNEQKVTVDHAGQHPPQRPQSQSSGPSRSRANGSASLPLITDDPSGDSDVSYSWQLVENDPAASAASGELAGDIPWVLRGQTENVKRARGMLERAIEAAQKPSATGYLILPDPRFHRVVVGQGGSQISTIRKETGTNVQVPRSNTGKGEDEAIEIVGSKEGVEQAKAIILDLVRNASSSGPRRG